MALPLLPWPQTFECVLCARHGVLASAQGAQTGQPRSHGARSETAVCSVSEYIERCPAQNQSLNLGGYLYAVSKQFHAFFQLRSRSSECLRLRSHVKVN